MRLTLERTVPFPRDDVYAWWTDFREDDHPGRPSPATSRRTVVGREGREIWLQERATRPAYLTLREHVTLDPPNGYTVSAHYPATDVRYEYRFESTWDGTRIRLVAEARPRHVMRVLLPLFRGRAQRYVERDTDYHVARMVRDLSLENPPLSPTSPRLPP